MTDDELRARIEINPEIMVGQPCIRGTRLTVHSILNMLAHGAPYEEILEDYSWLTRDDINACLLFASEHIQRSWSYASQLSHASAG